MKYKIQSCLPLWIWGTLFIIISGLTSCNVTRHVPDDAYLLRRNKIKLNADKKRNEKSELKEQLESLTAQKPNTYLFGIWPYKVWLYNLRYKKYQTDTSNFQIKSRTVEPPVILDTASIKKTMENMGYHLFNAGYFHHDITPSIDTDGKKAAVTYNVETGNRFIIKKIEYEVPDSNIHHMLLESTDASILKPEDYYSNTLAGEERNRIVNLMKERGYYNFTAENVRLELDTLSSSTTYSDNLAGSIIDIFLSRSYTNYEINVKIIVTDNQEQTAFKQYKIGNVIVYMNMTDTMRLGSLYQRANQDEILDDIQIIYEGDAYVGKNILERKILIKPNQMYSQSDYDRTIRQLTDLFVFQYVRIRYAESDREAEDPRVNVIILLSPSKKFEYNFNTEVSGGDIYIFGTNINTSITYNNIFKSANQLILTGSAGIAFENSENRKLQLFSQTFGANARLQVPGLLFFNPYLFGKNTYTRTILSGGLNYMDRAHFFFLRNINAGLTYQVTYPNFVTWNFKPAFVNILNLSNISEQFQQRMDSIPAIQNAYQPVFIEGQGVEYILNSNPRHQNSKHYVRLGLEEGGLLLSTINNITPIQNYAEYVRFDFDGRKYFFQ
ncbi:MAG: hypothetical protein KL787_00805 [Taibaiella sp.]|nr:hypothetical protein [Taibaiella sp.]